MKRPYQEFVPQGRPADPERRAATLAQATDYVLRNGLTGLSLRPLAAALGTSTRMLLYDFGSKERLVAEVLAEARRREAALLAEWRRESDAGDAATLHTIWAWIGAREREPFLRLFFEVYVDAIVHPDRYAGGAKAMVEDWLRTIATEWRVDVPDAETATLMIAVVRGLLLDRLATRQRKRTDAALARFVELLER
jgi:AcrR family transcriptional regulator